jgi:hypothetical protein
MTKIIVEALNKTGQRGIIGKGWGGIGNCKFSTKLCMSGANACFSVCMPSPGSNCVAFGFLSDKFKHRIEFPVHALSFQ